ncbi:hypothetical protein Glove_280g60 [Diversispora epigaea]|uniref:Uncharacterized protein n=1 Tax=Diversispora epigaea TaxID=1348612 RepID=A0A397I423_9GLOM|nr:hypothetical protein Glove_280g60 [Diversispora epigaea]
MDANKTRNRSKVLESIALRNACNALSLKDKIAQNITGIKEDIALLKEVLEKIIDICQLRVVVTRL